VRRSLLLGLDLGTSGVKAVLRSADGEGSFRVASVEYPLHTPRAGWSEQDPADWWDGTARVVREVLDANGVQPGEVAAVALSGQMHGATLMDAQGKVLRPCILWNDQRSGAMCDLITERVGMDNLVRWVANPALAGFTAPKLLWVRQHEPEVYSRIATVLLPKDYIVYQLTGEVATEASDASGTLLFDVAHREWSQEMAAALDVPLSWLPPVHQSTDVVGTVGVGAAERTGLLPGTPIVAGGADNACAAVGGGAIEGGQVLSSIGTSGTLVAPSAQPFLDPGARLHTFCHAVPDRWYLMGVVLSAGAALTWFRDVVMPGEPFEAVLARASEAPPGSEGLVFLPYLTGERTPHGDPHARGVFFGLSLRHGPQHLARAVVEGVTYALADSAALMRQLGIRLERVRATGGGSQSELWRRIQADVLSATVVPVADEAGPALGAAILAGVGVGAFDSVEEGVRRLVSAGPEVHPDPERAALYQRCLAVYDRLYPALREQFAALADLPG
jgi:xylulokinase